MERTPDEAVEHEWHVHGEWDLCSSEWVRLSLVDVEQPDGTRFEHHVVTMRPAAMTAVVDDSRTCVGLIWRHRFAAGVWNWELPGGLVDGDEDPEEAARRELLEEVGLEVDDLCHLVTFEPAVGMVRNRHHVYCATGARKVADPTEKNEGAALEWVAFDTIKARIAAGEIKNSGTLVALLHLLAFGIDLDPAAGGGRVTTGGHD